MSTITKTWNTDKIRSIIRKPDEKTGLNGSALPIAFNSYGGPWALPLSGNKRHLWSRKPAKNLFSTTRVLKVEI